MAFSFASATSIVTVTGGADSGAITSGASTMLTDTAKSWTTNQWAGRHVWIHSGTGEGQIRVISSNTSNALTIDRAWTTTPNNTSQYIIAHNFVDLKAANDSGSWGVVTGSGSQYRLSARLVLGDGTSGNRGFFGDLNESITFSLTSLPGFADYWSATHINVRDFSAVAFGRVLNATNKTSADGCSFLTEASSSGLAFPILRATAAGGIPTLSNATIHVVSSKFYRTTARTLIYVNSLTGDSFFWNCDLDRVEYSPGNAGTYNVNIQGGQFGISRSSGSFDRAIVANISADAVYTNITGEASATFRNLVTRNVGTWFSFQGAVTLDCYMVNPDADNKTIGVVSGGGTAKLWEQYEFDLTVRKASDSAALSSARVRLADSTGAEMLNTTTDANGAIPTQTLNRGFYTAANGSTITARTPHALRIRRYGYIPLALSLNITVKQAFNDFRAADPYVVASEATAGAYTGVALDGAAKTITLSSARSVQELYDYIQWWQVQSGNIQYDVSLTTTDGANYQIATGWTLIGASNLTFGARRFSGALRFTTAGSYGLNLGAGTLTFTTAGTYDLRAASIAGAVTLVNTSGGNVTVQLQPGVSFTPMGPNITVDNAVSASYTVYGLIPGSRLLIRRRDTQAVLMNESVAGTSRVYTYNYTADIPVEIVVRKATGSPAYQEWRTTATLTSSGGAATANQQLDE